MMVVSGPQKKAKTWSKASHLNYDNCGLVDAILTLANVRGWAYQSFCYCHLSLADESLLFSKIETKTDGPTTWLLYLHTLSYVC